MNHLALFEGCRIRRTLHKGKWWFSVIDVVETLTNSVNSRDYWFKLKTRVKDESGLELSTICLQLKLEAPDGKMRLTDCATTETLLRIIQSIPSPKAEPFKRWLAKVGYERLQELEDPERAVQRAHKIYKAKGYDSSWIGKRIRGIEVRNDLTDEWQKRGIDKAQHYALLTAEVSQATFELTPQQHKNIKGLGRENLRDHMTNLELIFCMLGEESTKEMAKALNARGFKENKHAAHEGSRIAGQARLNLERKTGCSVVSQQNFLIKNSSS